MECVRITSKQLLCCSISGNRLPTIDFQVRLRPLFQMSNTPNTNIFSSKARKINNFHITIRRKKNIISNSKLKLVLLNCVDWTSERISYYRKQWPHSKHFSHFCLKSCCWSEMRSTGITIQVMDTSLLLAQSFK